MSRNPHPLIKKLGAALAVAALAVCASLAIATPAFAADPATYGNLTFTSDDTLDGVTYDDNGQVVISGSANITVTQAEAPSDEAITSIVVGGEGDAAYTGSLSFSNVTLNPVAIQINGANVFFAGCTLTGSSSEATIVATGASTIAFSGTTTLTGGAGASGASPTDGTAALRANGDATISVAGTMTVNGGAGGNLDATQGTPTAGGAGIYAPTSTLSMESGSLTVKAGDTYTATAENTPAVLPVGLTVGAFDLSNGTGEAGEGPEVTAVGWPMATSKPLPVDGLDAGSADDETFYPWVLQASKSPDGSNAFLADFAGSGEAGPIEREGWRWFNIAPHEVTGLSIVAVSNWDEAWDYIYHEVNPWEGDADTTNYTLGLAPVFADLGDMTVQGWIEGATVPNPTVTPEDAIEWLDMGDYFTIPTDFTGESITFSGTATLPTTFTELYPGISTSVSTTIPVTSTKAIYRLYNKWNGDHLYTTDPAEVDSTIEAGWDYENVSWVQPAVLGEGDTTIVRLWNPYNGGHYYVQETDEHQLSFLESLGWRRDSEAANLISLPKESDNFPVYTLFNPYAETGTHLYTPSYDEVMFLKGLGWEENPTIIYAVPIEILYEEA